MFRHFLKVAYRSMLRKGKMSLLNIIGLSLGIACTLVISLYVFQERSYEKGHDRYSEIYRIEEHFLNMNRVAWTTSNLQFSLDDIPEIEAWARVKKLSSQTLLIDNKAVNPGRVLTADNRFFELFNYSSITGQSKELLTGPGSAVISEALAIRVFGSTDVVGQTLKLKNQPELIVNAVIATPVTRSHLDFDLLMHFSNAEKPTNSWYGIGGYTFVRTVPGATETQLKAQLDDVVAKKVFPVAFKPSPDMTLEEWMAHQNRIEFFPRPIADIYLNSGLQFELGAGGDAQMLITLSLIAAFILLIATINFMNLTTARSSGRTKEIGIRKVLGTKRYSLVWQFLFESLVVTLLAATIGAGLSEAMIYSINSYFGQVIGISLFSYTGLLPMVFVGVILLGVLAGLYPAFYLSSAKVIPLLKGMKLSYVLNLNVAKLLRNGLVVTQFTLSTAMIIATLFIYRQLIHLQEKDLGFDEEQVMLITNASDLGTNAEAFKNGILQIPGVKSASFSYRLPGDQSQSVHSVMLDANNSISFQNFAVDMDFVETLGLQMKAGEWFTDEMFKADSIVVINEAAVQALQLEEPIGAVIGNALKVVGVVENFDFASLRDEVGPALLTYREQGFLNMALKLSVDQVPFKEVENAWAQFTNMPLETKMLEQNFEELMYKEEQSANTVLTFTVLAIIISCLGLFGLAAFTADQRTHEFGVRKVLGASVADIVKIFGADFLKLIGMAFIISVPLAWYGVSQWLQGYSYRISLSMEVFLLAGLLAVLIAMSTILFQSLKSGRLNPIDTLRSE